MEGLEAEMWGEVFGEWDTAGAPAEKKGAFKQLEGGGPVLTSIDRVEY